MGHRKFYEQVLQDIMMQNAHKITDRGDVTTLKDYMQVRTTHLRIPVLLKVYNRTRTLDNIAFEIIRAASSSERSFGRRWGGGEVLPNSRCECQIVNNFGEEFWRTRHGLGGVQTVLWGGSLQKSVQNLQH